LHCYQIQRLIGRQSGIFPYAFRASIEDNRVGISELNDTFGPFGAILQRGRQSDRHLATAQCSLWLGTLCIHWYQSVSGHF